MGKTITPKYRIEMTHNGIASTAAAWSVAQHGAADGRNLAKYVASYNASLEPGQVNAHVAAAFGLEAARANFARIIRQADDVQVAAFALVRGKDTAPLLRLLNSR